MQLDEQVFATLVGRMNGNSAGEELLLFKVSGPVLERELKDWSEPPAIQVLCPTRLHGLHPNASSFTEATKFTGPVKFTGTVKTTRHAAK